MAPESMLLNTKHTSSLMEAYAGYSVREGKCAKNFILDVKLEV